MLFNGGRKSSLPALFIYTTSSAGDHFSCPDFPSLQQYYEQNSVDVTRNEMLSTEGKKKKKSWYSISRKQSSDPTIPREPQHASSMYLDESYTEDNYSRSYEEPRFHGYEKTHGRRSPFLTSFRKTMSSVRNAIKGSSELKKAASCSNINKAARTPDPTSFRSAEDIHLTMYRQRKTSSSTVSSLDDNSTDEESIRRSGSWPAKDAGNKPSRKVSCKGTFHQSISEDEVLYDIEDNKVSKSNESISQSITPRRKVSWADQSPRNSQLLPQYLVIEAPEPRPLWFPPLESESNPDISIDFIDGEIQQQLNEESRLISEATKQLFLQNQHDNTISYTKIPRDIYEDSSLNLSYTTVDNANNACDVIAQNGGADENNDTEMSFLLVDNGQAGFDDNNIDDYKKRETFIKTRDAVTQSDECLLNQEEEAVVESNYIMKSSVMKSSSSAGISNVPRYVYSVESTKKRTTSSSSVRYNKKKHSLTKTLSGGGGITITSTKKEDFNNNNNNDISCTDNNNNLIPTPTPAKQIVESGTTYRSMLGNSIVKKPYAVDDLYIPSYPTKNNQYDVNNIFHQNNQSNEFLHHSYSFGDGKALYRQISARGRPTYKLTNTISNSNSTRLEHSVSVDALQQQKSAVVVKPRVTIKDIKALVENILKRRLSDKTFDETRVTLWCKEIVNSVRDQLKLLTNSKRKVIASTYIGPKTEENSVHVAIKCQKQTDTDDFVTVAFESESLFVWVSLMMADR